MNKNKGQIYYFFGATRANIKGVLRGEKYVGIKTVWKLAGLIVKEKKTQHQADNCGPFVVDVNKPPIFPPTHMYKNEKQTKKSKKLSKEYSNYINTYCIELEKDITKKGY